MRAERQSELNAPEDVDIAALSTESRESSTSETVIELPSVLVRAWSTLSGELIRCVPETTPQTTADL